MLTGTFPASPVCSRWLTCMRASCFLPMRRTITRQTKENYCPRGTSPMAKLTKADAARQFGIFRTTLYKLIEQGKMSATTMLAMARDGLLRRVELGWYVVA